MRNTEISKRLDEYAPAFSDKICERCERKRCLAGERYCTHCRSVVLYMLRRYGKVFDVKGHPDALPPATG